MPDWAQQIKDARNKRRIYVDHNIELRHDKGYVVQTKTLDEEVDEIQAKAMLQEQIVEAVTDLLDGLPSSISIDNVEYKLDPDNLLVIFVYKGEFVLATTTISYRYLQSKRKRVLERWLRAWCKKQERLDEELKKEFMSNTE